MTESQAIGFVFFGPILLLWIATMLTKRTDRTRSDWVAERHRKIARNGFKSRIGAK